MTDVRLGQVRPTRMRRIGARHMIVLPQQQAQVLSLDDIDRSLRAARGQLQQLEGQVTRQRAFIADLEQQVAQFKALPVERVEDDPEVPQPEPPAARPVAENASRHLVPVPPPELTAADG